jgi:hypothetical protein
LDEKVRRILVRPQPPFSRDVDRRQLAALVWLHLTLVFRPVIDTSTGKVRQRPFFTQVVSNGMIAGMFTLNISGFDLRSYLILTFTAALSMAAFAVLPDTLEVARNRLEVLYSKPVGPNTFMAARAASIGSLAGFIATAFAWIPLVAARGLFDLSWLLIVGLYFVLIVGAFSASTAWLSLLQFSSRWLSVERMRRISLALLMIVMLASNVLTIVAREALRGAPPLHSSIVVRMLPSAWFAELLVADFEPIANAQRLGVLFVLMFSGSLFFGLDRSLRQPRWIEGLLSPEATPERPSRRVLIIEALAPLFGTAMTGVAALVFLAGNRDDETRFRLLAMQASFVLLTVFFALAAPPLLAVSGAVGFLLLIEALRLAQQSAHAQATWILFAAPVVGRDLLGGLWLAVFIKDFVLVLLAVGVVFFSHHPPELALVLTLGYLALGHLMAALWCTFHPVVPLAAEHSVSFAVTLILSQVIAAIAALAYAFIITAPIVFSALAVALLFGTGQLIFHRAGRTFGQGEYPF